MMVLYFLFFFTAIFSLVTNGTILIRKWKSGFRHTGGYITHVGFALMLIGIISSSTFGSGEKITVLLGNSKTALDYSIHFKDHESTVPKEQRSYFELTKGNKTILARTDSKGMVRGNQIQFVRTPFIYKYFLSDLYFSLENLADPALEDIKPFNLSAGELLAEYRPEIVEISKGSSTSIGDRKVKFANFETSQHQDNMGTKIGAILEIEYEKKTETIIPYYILLAGGNYSSPPVDFPGGGKISLVQILADRGSVVLSYSPEDEIPDIELGISVTVVSGTDTASVLLTYDASAPFSSDTEAEIPGGSLHLVDINPEDKQVQLIYYPESQPLLAQKSPS